jgi:hypothetical protein
MLEKMGKKFARYLDASPPRRKIWEWTKRIFFIGFSIPLLLGTFQRWHYFHDEMIYSGNKKQNLAYANQVDVKAYLMSQQNIIDLFEGEAPTPDTQTIPDKGETIFYHEQKSSDPRFYLVIGLKNNGDQICWGILENYSNEKKAHIIDVPPLGPRMKESKYIVIRAYPMDQKMPGDYPHLETKWLNLYTSKGEGP